jgi:hypothetical protein
MRNYLFIALIFTTLLISCTEEAPNFFGEWELDYIEFGEEKIYSNQLGEAKYYFDENGKYAIEVGGLVQNGKWKYKKNTITFTSDQNVDTKATIVKLNENEFSYSLENVEKDNVSSKVHFKK